MFLVMKCDIFILFLRACEYFQHKSVDTKNIMPSENSMIAALKKKIGSIPNTRIKKLWSSAANRDIDILVVTHGIACFYEIKVLGKEPTDWQYNKLAHWSQSGGDTGWFDTVDACVKRVQTIADRAAKHEAVITSILE
jgi:hypothetical protein